MRYKMIKIIAHIILEKLKKGRKIIPVVRVAHTILFLSGSIQLNIILNKGLSHLRTKSKRKVQSVNDIYNVSDIKTTSYLAEDHVTKVSYILSI